MAELRDQLQATLGDSLILEQELGGGGMSRVFVAHEPSLGRKVVVKVLPPEMAAGVSIDRFRREIQLAAQLQHPHIVPLLAAGETDGLPYYTMPFVRGDSLRSRLAKGGELPVADTVRILREVASALAYAHEAGVVHRDIKPENVLISGGSAVVTDFGVAKALTASSGAAGGSLTSLGVALGTPAYMAPEQASADPNIDHRADIYALGVMAYEMLSGSTPFPGRSAQATLAAQVTENPEPITRRRATVPPHLGSLVMSCLEKHAADRPQTATQVMHELDALTTPGGGMEPTVRSASSRAGRKRRMWKGITAMAVILIGTFVVWRVRAPGSASGGASGTPAIAVLPFENVGRKEGQEFTDGMTEEVTNRLSSLRGLRVIARQSSRGYAGTTKTPQQIASELGVNYLLTGTVRWDRAADGKELVRVSPALVRGADATQLWSEPFQAAVSGMFDVQSRIAAEVASALDVKLVAPEKAALSEKPTENLEAYTLFLRGRELIENTFSPSQFREAIRVLEAAVAADPKFTSAWSYLAVAHTEMFWSYGDRTEARLRMAREALAQATKLDPNDADVRFASGTYLYHGERDFDRALAEFALVETTRPNDPKAPVSAAAIMRRQGRWDQAIANLKRGIDLDPRNGKNLLDLAYTLIVRNRYAEAEEYVDRAMIVEPEAAFGANLKTVLAIARRGNVQEAVQHLRNAMSKVQPASSRLALLQQWIWPSIEDPELRRMLIDATYSSDGVKSDFYGTKAVLFRYLGDSVRTHAYVDSTVTELTASIRRARDPSQSYMPLGVAEALRGNRNAALRALRMSAEALPESRDALVALDRESAAIAVYAILGDTDSAIPAIEKLVRRSGILPLNVLRLDPIFAAIRNDPRFRRLINKA